MQVLQKSKAPRSVIPNERRYLILLPWASKISAFANNPRIRISRALGKIFSVIFVSFNMVNFESVIYFLKLSMVTVKGKSHPFRKSFRLLGSTLEFESWNQSWITNLLFLRRHLYKPEKR